MKSTLTIPTTEVTPSIFPCLAQNLESELIVLFSEEGKGTVIFEKKRDFHLIGDYSESWSGPSNSDYWKILPPGTSITLTV
jgi:hypothetical protein